MKLFLEQIIGDKFIFSSDYGEDDSEDDGIYGGKDYSEIVVCSHVDEKDSTSNLVIGFFYDVVFNEDGKYYLKSDTEGIAGKADLKIDVSYTYQRNGEVKQYTRDVKLSSYFFSKMYHEDRLSKPVSEWRKLLDKIQKFLLKNELLIRDDIRNSSLYNAVEIAKKKVFKDERNINFDDAYAYLPIIKELIGTKGIGRYTCSVIMHAIAREKFTVFNQECDNLLMMADIYGYSRFNTIHDWPTRYIEYSNILQKKVIDYHTNVQGVKDDKKYLEAASYYVKNFSIGEFLYDECL